MGLANNNVTVLFAAPTPGQCTPSNAAALMILLNSLVSADVTATGSTSFYNFGDTTPSAENQIYPWLKTQLGYPVGWFVYVDGAWRLNNPPRLWWSGITGGAVNTYTATTIQTYPSLVLLTVGDVFIAAINITNTGPSTLAINGFAAANIQNAGAPLVAGELVAGQTYAFLWDGTNFRVLNATVPESIPVNVYASSSWTSIATTDLDLSFVIPTGKTTWKTVTMFGTHKLDSQAGNAVTGAITFKWNCGILLNTAVTTGSSTGAGNSGQAYDVSDDMQIFPIHQWTGEVPFSINTVGPLIIRATLVITGAHDPGNWQFWATAVAT